MRSIICQGKKKGRNFFRLLAILMAVTVAVTMCPALQSAAYGASTKEAASLKIEEPEILVTGTKIIGSSSYASDNVSREKAYTRAQLKKLSGASDAVYSAINTYHTKKLYKTSGVYVSSLLTGTAFDGSKDKLTFKASDGAYTASFDPAAKYDNGSADTTGFNETRYYYPKLLDETPSTSGSKEVKTMLSWASNNSSKAIPGSAGSEKDYCTLIAGQLSLDDQNNPLYTKYVQKIVGGEELADPLITVDGKKYTRGDILLMKRAEKSYTYKDSGGASATDYVRGVPMSVLLEGCDDSSTVSFATADNYPVGATGESVKELVDGNYILAYERGTSASDLKGIYDTAKKDASKKGYFALYGDGDNVKPAKLINSITVTASSGIDYVKSSYKHITNGGNPDADGPYDIDGITGATLTVEGPGVKNSVPVSVRDLEGKNNGAFRGKYTDTRDGTETDRTYEGIDLYYILNNMSSGDSGIILTDTAKKVLIKNRNRKTTATFTMAQIKDLHDKGSPILVAYGTSMADGSNIRPFVFDGAAGQDLSLGNDDGCLKLVYDKKAIAGDLNSDYTKFSNMAYIYVAEDSSPGYKHEKSPYDTAENSQYVLTVTGEEVGREVNYTVKQLEDMVKYGSSGKPETDGIGYRDEYSLANSSYWYVNEYEGVKLWDLLQMSGVPGGKASDDKTKVKFSARDGYTAFDEFSLKQVADPDSFGYYEKNAADNNDGKYEPIADDLKKTGYPVLVAYGVNQYPYVINNKLDGFMSGLSNDGGPLRIISGKTDYKHANGSNQAKLLDKVLAGKDTYHYSTHKYHNKDVYKNQADETLKVKIVNGSEPNAPVLKEKTYNVGEIEELIYGGSLTSAQLSDAKIKGFYEVGKGSKFYSDLYEGVNLNYFLKDVVELPGYKGTITFSDGTNSLPLNLEEVLKLTDGHNDATKLGGLSPVLAYSKNGAPLVASKEAVGYESQVTLGQGTKFENAVDVKNSGGPLSVVFPRSASGVNDAKSLSNVTSITINVSPDKYAHTTAPYDAYKDQKLEISGAGTRLTEKTELSLSELEGKQTLAATGDYSVLKSEVGQASQQRYRGIGLYDLLKSNAVGLKSNADKVVITCSDGSKKEFSLSDVRKSNYINSITKKDDLKMILAYGSAAVSNTDKEDGLPLVKDSGAAGYNADYGNSGGPLKLVVGQKTETDANSSKILKDVTAIEVTASNMTSWNHSSSEVFKQYLTDKLDLQVVDEAGKSLFKKTYTIEELENMISLVEREEISSTSVNTWEGLNMWDFVLQEAGSVKGIDDPTTVTATAKDGFSKELRAIFGMDGLKNGIKDGERRVPILLAYGMDGYPLASGSKSNPNGEGYDSTIGNNGGPIRLMTHNNQGACLSETNKIVIKVKKSAEPQETVKFNVNHADGKDLPQAGVRSVKFDKDGGMWVGTYGGGAAYKAKGAEKFAIYNKSSKPALETSFVSAVAPDNDGGVWMSQNASYTDPAANKGVVYMKDGKITSYRASDSPKTIPDDYVQDIKVDDQNCVWFGSFGGLTKYDPAAGTWTTWDKSDGFPAMSVDRLEFDGKGGVWCGFYPDGKGDKESDPFKGGFAHIDKSGKITPYSQTAGFDTESSQSKLADVWVRDIAVDKNGAAWITASGAYADLTNTGGTLWYVKEPGSEAKKYTGDELFGKALTGAGNAEIRMVEADSAGGLWFGTSADGIFYVKEPTVQSDRSFDLTAEYSKETGSWSEPLMNNIYSLDVKGSMIYAGSSGGLAWVDHLAPGKNNVGDASAGECDLAITGAGVTNNGFFTIKGLKNANGINQLTKSYAWRNSSGSTGTVQAEGAYVENILKDIVGLDKKAGSVTFVASDGYKKSIDMSVLTSADMKGNKPMLAWKEDGNKIDPKLIIGQKNANDANKSTWVSNVTKIIVDIKQGPDEAEQAKKLLQKKITVKATAPSYNSAKLSWTKVAGASGYTVSRATSKAGTYKQIATTNKDSLCAYTDKNLKTGTTYYYKVKAYKKTSEKTFYGGYSAAASAKPALNGIKTIKTSSGGTYVIKASWSKVSGASGYALYKASSKNGKYKRAATVKGRSYTVKKLKPGKKYYFKARAYRKISGKTVYGAYSKKVSVIPRPSAPKLKLKSGKRTIKASWKKVKDVSGYKIYRAKGKAGKYKCIRKAGKKSTSYTSHRLSRKTTYHYKIRAYKMVNGKPVYSKTVAKKIKTK